MSGLEERFLEFDGGRLRYLCGGSGTPLLLAHGFTGSAENFETWFDDLLPLRRLVIPDLPGFGASTPLRGRHTAEALADALDALVHAEQMETFDLGGLCIGACIALALLRRRMDRVQRLILHTPLLEPELVLPRFHRQAGLLTAPGIFSAVVWLARQRRISDWYKRHFTEDENVDDRGADMNFRNQQRATPRASREWLRDGLRRHDLGTVRRFGGETLVLVAGDDRIVDIGALHRVLDPLEHVRIAEFDNAGHGWSEDLVRRQNAVLTAFLEGRELPPTSGHVVAA